MRPGGARYLGLCCIPGRVSKNQWANCVGFTNVNVEPGVADVRTAGKRELIHLQVANAGTFAEAARTL